MHFRGTNIVLNPSKDITQATKVLPKLNNAYFFNFLKFVCQNSIILVLVNDVTLFSNFNLKLKKTICLINFMKYFLNFKNYL